MTPQVGAARVNMQPNAGGKVYGNVETCKISFYAGSNSSPTQPPLKKPATTGRGFPPPIPPNKPVVPPKKDVIRRVENEKGGSDQMGIKYNVNLRDKVHCPEVHEEESSRREPQVKIFHPSSISHIFFFFFKFTITNVMQCLSNKCVFISRKRALREKKTG